MVFCSFYSVLFLLSSLSLTNFLVRLVLVLVVIRSPVDQHRRSGSPYQRQLWLRLRREGFHLSISSFQPWSNLRRQIPYCIFHWVASCFRYVPPCLQCLWPLTHMGMDASHHCHHNVPRYNTTSAESEPEWRTIYWSKTQSYIIQHCVGALPKEGTTSLTDVSIITPKDNCRKQLSFCCLIRLLLLWIYINIARNL